MHLSQILSLPIHIPPKHTHTLTVFLPPPDISVGQTNGRPREFPCNYFRVLSHLLQSSWNHSPLCSGSSDVHAHSNLNTPLYC